jgi:E3 SUMO-protein ligase NSE2
MASSSRGSRVSHPTPGAASSSSRANNRPATPEYEPLEAPLNATGQHALAALLAAKHFRTVNEHIKQAAEKLTEIASEANERATDARHRFNTSSSRKKRATTAENKKRRKKMKTGADGDDEIEDEDEDEDEEEDDEKEEEDEEDDEEENEERQQEARKLENLEQKVKTTTAQLEERMRGLVDAEYKLSGLKVAVQELNQEAEVAGAALNATRRRARLRDRAALDADGDEEMDDAHEDENIAPTVVPSQFLTAKLAAQKTQWERQSLTDR